MNNKDLANTPHFAALEKFIDGVNKLKADYWTKMDFTFNSPGKVMVHSVGPRYAKLAAFEQMPAHTGPYKANSVYCFFDIASGDLIKGTWKAPVAKGVRGNVNDRDVIKFFNQHGPAYLR